MVYGRPQKVGTSPSSDPKTRARRKTSMNHLKSMFQLFGVCCRVDFLINDSKALSTFSFRYGLPAPAVCECSPGGRGPCRT